MLTQFLDWLTLALDVFHQSDRRIIWNLFLALIPLTLSFWLFRPLKSPSGIWWVICLLFIAFLPNAPYILTDIIHVPEIVAGEYPFSVVLLVLIPQYILFIWIGFQAYAISLLRLDNYLIDREGEKYLIAVNAIVHGLCVIGIYLGRFERFNSWDLVSRPIYVFTTTLQDLLQFEVILALFLAFFWLWISSWVVKRFDRLAMSKIGLDSFLFR